MHIILLCGGMGKRLWPLSDKNNPKQFLQVFPGPNGKQSMVQRVYAQLKHEGLAENSLICSGKEQEALLKAQLGDDAAMVLEPQARDTFPAIALSCSYLLSEQNASDDDPVVVVPIDPYVDFAYYESLKRLPELLDETDAQILLMGKTPTGPEEKYGYILPESEKNGVVTVAGFQEKPNAEKAAELLSMGALWNIGVFCFRLGLIREWLGEYELDADYNTLYTSFEKLPNISFDYQVLEHSTQIAALRFDGIWRDLGTWGELSEVLPQQFGRCMQHKCDNTFVLNMLNIPLVTIGLDNAVVVITENGILISNRDQAQEVKILNSKFP